MWIEEFRCQQYCKNFNFHISKTLEHLPLCLPSRTSGQVWLSLDELGRQPWGTVLGFFFFLSLWWIRLRPETLKERLCLMGWSVSLNRMVCLPLCVGQWRRWHPPGNPTPATVSRLLWVSLQCSGGMGLSKSMTDTPVLKRVKLWGIVTDWFHLSKNFCDT